MAGTIKVDSINADSNLALKIANTAVAFIDSSGLRPVGGNVSLDATATSKVFLPSANTVAIQTAGVTALSVSSSQVVTLANALPVGSGGTGATSLSGITVGTATSATSATTATNLAGGSNGTIPYQSANGTTQMLAVGTSGQLLQTNGAGAPSWVTPSAGAMVVLTSGTVSGSPSAIDVETGFTDTSYALIIIYYQNIACASSSGNPSFRFKIGGTYNSSSVYNSRNFETSASSSSVNSASSQSSMVFGAVPQITSDGTSFAIVIQNRFQGARSGAAFITNPWWAHQNNGTAAGTSYGYISGTSGDVQGLRLLMTGGGGATTFSDGTYVAYGIKAT
jgi:hypothetical protein